MEFAYIPVGQVPADRYPQVFMAAPLTLPKFRQQLILAFLMACSLLMWKENTVLSTTLETLADPVRGLGANPGQLQCATGSYTLAFATLVGLAVPVPNFRSPTPRPLDPAGMLLSISGLVALAYGLIRAGQVAASPPPSTGPYLLRLLVMRLSLQCTSVPAGSRPSHSSEQLCC
ncbi:hypothetical protein [Streptomyces sp. C184]|uniref:hypothetical protein n=1 Tax=Streptomyces sp. C184 TaxID=3237121 RepID=UPI0034C65573